MTTRAPLLALAVHGGPLYRCQGLSHKGSKPLPREAFGDSRCSPEGRNRVCKACRAASNRRARKRKPSDNRTARICLGAGCMEPPAHRGTSYCAEHRQRGPDGREIRRTRLEPQRTTYHDIAVGILAGSGKRPHD